MADVEITLTDLEDARTLLAACETYFTARDMQEAQLKLVAHRSSPLAAEVERVRARFDGYLADHLLERHEAGREAEGAEEEPPEEETLSDEPLGSNAFPKQTGRRLTREELEAAAEDATE